MGPFGQHEGRWFSAGKPTSLVLDGGHESHDPQPSDIYDGELTRMKGKPFPAHFDGDESVDQQALLSRLSAIAARPGSGGIGF